MARRKRLLHIGLMLNRGAEYGYRAALGIVRYFRERGGCEFHPLPAERGALETTRALIKFDGLIVHASSPKQCVLARSFGCPVVNMSTRARAQDLPSVVTDDVAIGRLVAEYFVAQGFRSFGFLGMEGTGFADDRRKGFVEYLSEAGFGCRVAANELLMVGSRGDREWLRGLTKPVAVMAANDNRGWHLVAQAVAFGLHVPGDIAVVGVDNDLFDCGMPPVSLSSVDPGFDNVGYRAAQCLHDMIRGGRPPPQPILLPPRRIVVRHSSDVLAVRDGLVAAALRHIRQHSHEPISIADMAEALHVSRRRLERRFVEVLGRSPGTELRRARVMLARELLATSDISVADVAERSGYSDAKVFGDAFRRVAGMSPTAYRRLIPLPDPS